MIFQKIKSDDYIINQDDLTPTIDLFESDVSEWINYFISDSLIIPYLLFFYSPRILYI